MKQALETKSNIKQELQEEIMQVQQKNFSVQKIFQKKLEELITMSINL